MKQKAKAVIDPTSDAPSARIPPNDAASSEEKDSNESDTPTPDFPDTIATDGKEDDPMNPQPTSVPYKKVNWAEMVK